MVVTGLGIVSCIGNSAETVVDALRHQRCGIRFIPEYAELGLRSQLAGVPDLTHEASVARKFRRYMGDASLYAYHAMRQAVADAALSPAMVAHPRTGVVTGSGIGSGFHHVQAIQILRERGADRIPPYTVPQAMASTTSACLSTAYGIQGVSYSMTAACATSAHCVGHAADLIRMGKQDVVFAGGGEEVCWTTTAPFDAMGALSTHFNDAPMTASRPYDADRDGFVIAGGAGILVLESLAHALARGARIYAEMIGYGATSDGLDMVNPNPEGCARAMRLALAEADRRVDYVNTHATSTPAGDLVEVQAMREVFGPTMPDYSSTKGLTGHSIGAAGAQELIYSLLMMHNGFIGGSPLAGRIAPEITGHAPIFAPIQREFTTIMSNSLGFGGSNASLILTRDIG